MYYIHLQNFDVQNKIKNLCRGKSGVYKITNLINKKIYVGSAISKKYTQNRLYIRFRNHFFNTHKPFPVTRAVQKYGVQHFSWEILEFTEISSTRERETYYIQTLLPEYNILQQADSSIGYQHTNETLLKMKTRYSESRRLRIGNFNKNKQLDFETRQKISKAALKRTPEQKKTHQQICDIFNKSKFSKKTQVLDGNTQKVLGTYASLRQACLAWNGNYRTFKRVVKSGNKIHKLNIYVKYIS